jgi:hypothetical protein
VSVKATGEPKDELRLGGGTDGYESGGTARGGGGALPLELGGVVALVPVLIYDAGSGESDGESVDEAPDDGGGRCTCDGGRGIGTGCGSGGARAAGAGAGSADAMGEERCEGARRCVGCENGSCAGERPMRWSTGRPSCGRGRRQ